MKDLLLRRHHTTLRRFVGAGRAREILVALDFDGVLAPLVRAPEGAPMSPTTRALLAAVARRYPTAVISGRSWTHLAARVDVPGVLAVGNHGFELGRPSPVPARTVRRVEGWRRDLAAALAGVPGIHFEQKRSTLAVHYGLSRAWRGAEVRVFEEARRLPGVRLVTGKRVLNLLPVGSPSKGDAVQALLARGRLAAALYVGDDVTDEDVFRLGSPLVFGVHVGTGPSLAPWRLGARRDVDRLLRLLVGWREPSADAARRLAR